MEGKKTYDTIHIYKAYSMQCINMDEQEMTNY